MLRGETELVVLMNAPNNALYYGAVPRFLVRDVTPLPSAGAIEAWAERRQQNVFAVLNTSWLVLLLSTDVGDNPNICLSPFN